VTGNQPQSLLQGVTVVDFTTNIAGPFGSLILNDLGARVLKVEPPRGDDARYWPPLVEGNGAPFIALNRGKLSVAIDAKRSEGRAVVLRLVEQADVFLESMRPTKAAELGLAWEDMREVNPHLIYGSVNAFGDEGPLAGHAGLDAIVQAYSGIMDLTGYPDGQPCRVGTAILDVGTGMWAAMSVLAALLQPKQERGGRIQTTLLGTAVAFLIHHLTAAQLAGTKPQRLGTAQHNFAPYQALHAEDGLVMVGVNSDRMWRRFCSVIGSPRLRDDPRFTTNSDRLAARDELIAAVESRTRRLSTSHMVESLQEAGIPASTVRPITSLLDDPQLDTLKLWLTTPEGFTIPRIPMPFASSSAGVVPAAGQHTVDILRAAGLSAKEIEKLIANKVVFTADRAS
jgi:crotonobetainyl-CoA:carnitine CoA-transferase CaiB-like acyl-CoA transferase